MDAIALATLVVNLLSPHLAKMGEGLARGAGEIAWEKGKQIYSIVKEKLAGDDYAAQTLKRLEKDPQSKPKQSALLGILEEKLNESPDFTEQLLGLIDEYQAAGGEVIQQDVTISNHSKTGDITLVGKVMGSRLNFRKNKMPESE